MSQHSQRTQFGPSRASVATTGVLVGLSALATGYVTSGPWDARQIVATVLGVGLTTLLLARVFSLMAERAVIADRAEREAERVTRAERAERESGHLWELEAWQNAAAGLLDAYLTGRAVNFGGEPVPDYVRTRLADLAPPPVSQPEPPVDEGPVVYPPQPDVDQTRTWLADPEVAARYAEPYVEPPRVTADAYPPGAFPQDPVAREVDRAVTGYLDEELDPAGYQRAAPRPPETWVEEPEPWGPAEQRAAAVLDRVVAENTSGYPVAEPPYQRPTMQPWNAFEPASARRPELASVPVPLPPRNPDPDGYVDPGPYTSWVPSRAAAPHDPDARNWRAVRPADTEIMGRVQDEDATEVIDRVR